MNCIRPTLGADLLFVQEDNADWARVAHDIDPRRRPQFTGVVRADNGPQLVAWMSAAGFTLEASYRFDGHSTAFLFSRATAEPEVSQV